MRYLIVLLTLFCLSLFTIDAYAQKDVGKVEGLSNKTENLDMFTFKGIVEAIKEGPCKNTRGPSLSGTHLLIEVGENQIINCHLGPTEEVWSFVEGIEGKIVVLHVFRTDDLKDGHYITKRLQVDGKIIVLRDDLLQPIWSKAL